MVVVSGAPGTGKSTVAAALGVALGWPVVSLDTVKESLADVLGIGDEDWSHQLGDAAAEVVFRLCRDFPQAVVEGWWRGDRRLRALHEFAGAVEVFCHCDPDVAVQRMRLRSSAGRHPIHRDVINPTMLTTAGVTVQRTTPLGLGSLLVHVETDRGQPPDAAVAEVRAALGLPGSSSTP